jgi:predicted negative regulator of RcsB-dependent stress response
MADDQKQQDQDEPQLQPVTADEVAPVSEPTAEQTETHQLLGLFREHGQPVLIGLGLALAIIFGFGAYKNYKKSVTLRASQMLMAARSTEQLQQIANMYSSTPSAPIALLALAGQYFDAGQFDLAQFTYAQFEQKYPEHPMKLSAELGRAHCLEGSGQPEQALTAFEAFAATHTNHFLTPMAELSRARCLTQLGRFEDARAAYEGFIVAHPESGWASLAESALLFVDKEMRNRKKGSVLSSNEPAAVPAVALPPAAALTAGAVTATGETLPSSGPAVPAPAQPAR